MNISQLQSSPYINRSSFVKSANAVQGTGGGDADGDGDGRGRRAQGGGPAGGMGQALLQALQSLGLTPPAATSTPATTPTTATGSATPAATSATGTSATQDSS